MVTSVTLGNLVTVNGKTRSVGNSSGLDVESIVNSLVDVKKLDLTKITDKITADTSKLSAVSQYRTLLANLQTTMGFLENPSGVNNDAKNVFQYRSITASTSDGTAPGNYITASTSAGATLGTYNIQVNNLAVAQNSSSRAFTSNADALATAAGAGGTPKAGSFTINGQTVTIAVGDTLQNIAAQINGTTASSKVRADIIKVSDTDYRLKITALQTGVSNGYTIGGDTTVFDSMFTGGASTAVAAVDSSITLDNNLTITRATNVLSDMISGVTFTLGQPTAPGSSINVNVVADPTSVANKIGDFVDAYNAIKTFIATQQQRDESGNLLETAVMGEDGVLNNFASSAAAELATAVSGITGNIKSLGDIGIGYTDSAGDDSTPAVNNLLQIDTAKLQTQLDGDFDGVRKLFELQLNSSAPDRVGISSTTNEISVNAFTMTVDLNQPAASQVMLNYTDSNGIAQSVAATTSFGTASVASSKDVANGIFGATTVGSAFTGLVDGDTFRITENKVDGTTANYDFVYKAAPVAANEFSNLSSLTSAISATITDATTTISNGKISITPTGQFDTFTFTNTTATDFKTTLGFVNTKMPTGTVTGAAGSALAGLKLVFAPKTPTDSITLTLTQGIADRISNLLKSYLDANTGFLDLRVGDINTDKDKLTKDSTSMQEKIDAYQTQLYNQYSLLDQAVTKVNSLLQLLDAQDKARQQAAG
jgi:flagellar hook-associated protein 2